MSARRSGPDGQEVAASPVRTDREVAAARRLLPNASGSSGLDRLAELAARLLGASAAQVSLLTDEHRVAAGAGLAAGAAGFRGPLAESLCTVTAATRAPLVVPDAPADVRVCDLPPVTRGRVGAYLGVPLTGDDGQVVGALCVFDPSPRDWRASDVSVLEQLAASVVAELELSALSGEYHATRTRWELAIDAAGIGSFDWDLVTGTLEWDERLIDLFGYDAGTFDHSIEAFNARLHPDDLPRVTTALESAIDECGTFEAEYRVVRPDGTLRWVEARGRALCDETGTAVRLIGAGYDTTAVREGEARTARVLESMSAGFYSLDAQWRFTYVNAEAERLLGARRDELLGQVVWELYPAAVASEFENWFRAAVETGTPTTFEAYYPAPLDGWFELRAWPSPDGLWVYFLDVTARRAALERVTLLARVTAELAETLDPEEAVGRLARLVVPALGDWCVVTLVGDDTQGDWRRRLRDVGRWHADPGMRPLLDRYAEHRVADLTDESFLARALLRAQPLVIRGATEAIEAVLCPGVARDVLHRLAPRSAVVQPLRARGRTLALLTVFWSDRTEPPERDLEALAEIAGRAGLALDNTRLYEQQRHLAEGLQRSLLTEPPEPDHMQVVVRYVPAAEAAQVGGDWYDAFLQRDGSTVLVIGDVVGHDVDAAAAMGQVRGLLRGIAARTGDGPADVLTGLDETMELLQVVTTATAVVARIEQTDDERKRDVTRLRWSNAGHPPPVAITPDGSVHVLGSSATGEGDLLLGIDPSTTRTEAAVTLDRGATVLLYTDGLVERRGQSLDEGVAKLRDTLAELADRTLDELCDAVLARMLPASADDDVALTAVRLHRQDRPRPPEAGPTRVPASVADD